jgi:type VI secretion system protein ImpK
MANKDDPFAEPGDTEKTVVNLNPGGRVPMAYAAPAEQAARPAAYVAAAPAPQMGAVVDMSAANSGLNQLNAAAAPLFSLVGRIRNRAQHNDPVALRTSVVQEIQRFESAALMAQVPAQQVKIARYAICATIDDVVLNTPWGGRSVWAQQSMVGTFHKETHGGDRFYELLARLEKEPTVNLVLLEFIFMCLSLGFEGRLRVEDRGAEKHATIRASLASLIRAQRGPLEHEVSPVWKGLSLPHKPLNAWMPAWLIFGLVTAVLGLSYVGLAWALTGDTDRLQGQLAALGATEKVELRRRAPPPPPPPVIESTQKERVSKFLEKEITEKLVTVFEDANTLTVRIAGSGMFQPASDTMVDSFLPIMKRIAEALNEEPGKVIIAGHSDNIPIKTARFPSNLHLSLKRAESVMHSIADSIADETRMSAEGRSDVEPIADNKTKEGRAENRRIEVILIRES